MSKREIAVWSLLIASLMVGTAGLTLVLFGNVRIGLALALLSMTLRIIQKSILL